MNELWNKNWKGDLEGFSPKEQKWNWEVAMPKPEEPEKDWQKAWDAVFKTKPEWDGAPQKIGDMYVEYAAITELENRLVQNITNEYDKQILKKLIEQYGDEHAKPLE